MLYQVLKHETQPSVFGLDTTRIVNFVNYLKSVTVHPSIVIPPNSNTFSDWRRKCHLPLVKTQ